MNHEDQRVTIAISTGMKMLHCCLRNLSRILAASTLIDKSFGNEFFDAAGEDARLPPIQNAREYADQASPPTADEMRRLIGSDRLLQRFIIASAFGAFERYLKDEVTRFTRKEALDESGYNTDRRLTHRGALISLSNSRYLIESQYPPEFHMLCTGDVFRCIRHNVLHDTQWRLPTSDDQVARWVEAAFKFETIHGGWSLGPIESKFREVVRGLEKLRMASEQRDEGLSWEFFAAQGALQHFERLGVHLEESVIPEGDRKLGRISCPKSWVRRNDLICPRSGETSRTG